MAKKAMPAPKKDLVERLKEIDPKDALLVVVGLFSLQFTWFIGFICIGLFVYFGMYKVERKNLRGKKVLLTGGGSGIGKLIAKLLASQGCELVLWDLREDLLEQTAKEIKEQYPSAPRVRTFVCDVSNRETVYKKAKEVKDQVTTVDIIINNAGIVSGKRFLDCPDELIVKTMDVNINAHFWIAKSFLPDMINRNDGHIVTIASAAGTVGVPKLADYCASKHAAVGFDESLRLEMKATGKTGVKTTCVCPYYINTGMFEGVSQHPVFKFVLPILEPDYVAAQVVDAIRTDKEVLKLPRLVYAGPLLRAVLPVTVFDWMGDLLGMTSSMESFKGRGDAWALGKKE